MLFVCVCVHMCLLNLIINYFKGDINFNNLATYLHVFIFIAYSFETAYRSLVIFKLSYISLVTTTAIFLCLCY